MEAQTIASKIVEAGLQVAPGRFLVLQREAPRMIGAIHIPDQAVDPVQVGDVVARGDGCPEWIAVGTEVQWPAMHMVRINVFGYPLILMSREDVGCFTRS